LPGQCRSGSGRDSFVRKYDPEGAEAWTRQFGTSDSVFANAVALHPSGVYVGGQVLPDAFRDEWEDFQPFEGFEPAGSGAFLAKFEKTAAPASVSVPRIFPDCVVNAASYVGGGVAPGEIVTIFGSAMGPSELVPLRLTDDRRLATALAETRVLFNGVPAPLVYVSDKQVSAIVPYVVAGRSSVDVQVEYAGLRSEAPFSASVATQLIATMTFGPRVSVNNFRKPGARTTLAVRGLSEMIVAYWITFLRLRVNSGVSFFNSTAAFSSAAARKAFWSTSNALNSFSDRQTGSPSFTNAGASTARSEPGMP